MRLRRLPTTRYAATPISTPPPAATAKSTPTRQAAMPVPAAARAVRSATSAVASLNSDSPSRMVTTRRGRPIVRPTAVVATASGGATTAPTANASAQLRPGSAACRRRPTPAAVNTTSPTASHTIERRLALKSTSEEPIAVE